METEETIETGEITFGSHYTNSEYIIESPVKRAPSFGAGDLIGLDLNIYHDNITYDKHITVPDVEVYKFKTSLESAKTEGTFGVPTAAKANVIVGSMSYKGANTSSITESFDGGSTFTGSLARGNQKRGINSKAEPSEPYLLLDDAWAIQEGDKGNHKSRDRSQGISKKSSFRKQHCVEYEGQWILPLKKGYGNKIIKVLIDKSRKLNIQKISVETGSGEFFLPARKLFKNLGFTECKPFSHYIDDPNSCYMSLKL